MQRASGLQGRAEVPSEGEGALDPAGGCSAQSTGSASTACYAMAWHGCRRRRSPELAELHPACRMPAKRILDRWNPGPKRYRAETSCYGPISCRPYRVAATRTVASNRLEMRAVT